MLAANQEPAGKRPLAALGGAHDGGASRSLLPPFPIPLTTVTLDIDDTCDPVHGDQQLSLFHVHCDTRCFLPVHVYHVESGKPVAVRHDPPTDS